MDRGASEELKKLESQYVHFTGRVDDVRDYLEKCKVFVCPMTFGSGVKTKNLEAMSMGIPVVTTSIGAENIDAENEKEWIIEDTPNEFSKAVIKLLNDEKLREEMGLNSSAFINKSYTWNVTKAKFAELLDSIKC